jgi:hypothetical protein
MTYSFLAVVIRVVVTLQVRKQGNVLRSWLALMMRSPSMPTPRKVRTNHAPAPVAWHIPALGSPAGRCFLFTCVPAERNSSARYPLILYPISQEEKRYG